MFANAVRSCASLNKFIASKNILLPKRKFSIISIHTSFPASIYRFQPQRSSGLFGYKQDGDIEDGLKVSANGLIYPRVSHDVPFSNGAVFMPNTFTMQQWVRTSFDNYVEGLEDDQSTLNTTILQVQKGILVPNTLALLREDSSRFSLQPSRPMNIKDLNDLLSEFYHRYATFTNAEEWMDRNEYHNSIADCAVEKWMCQ